MNISFKKRIYLGFIVCVSLLTINAVIAIYTLEKNRKLAIHSSEVIDPSITALSDFEKMMLASKTYTTNWVFLRSNEADKMALVKIHASDYQELKLQLQLYSSKWNRRNWADSLNHIFTGFEQVLSHQKYILHSLNDYRDYDNADKKVAAQQELENIVLPQTAQLIKQLEDIIAYEQGVRMIEGNTLKSDAINLRMFIIYSTAVMIAIGLLLSVYMAKVITGPLRKIIHILNNLGKGNILKVDHPQSRDEIGAMVRSVNNLSEKLFESATFAHEIGNHNYNIPFKPLSEADTLGKALIAMRDNIKLSDEGFNEAQHIAQLGSWERDPKNNTIVWSDEMLRIFDIDANYNYTYQTYLDIIHPDDLGYVKDLAKKYLIDHQPIAYQCRITTHKGIQKTIHAEGKVVLNEEGEIVKTLGIVQDITARKKTEEVIAESEKKYRTLFEKMIDGVYKSTSAGKFIEVNPAFVKMLGYDSKEELLAIDIKSQLYFETSERDNAVLQDSMEGMAVFRLKKKDGSEIWVEDRGQYVSDENGVILYHEGILRDVTQRIKAEIALKESEAFNKGVLASLSSHIAVIDESGMIIAVNKAWNDFAIVNGETNLERTPSGINYFDVCKKAIATGDNLVKQALEGIHSVLKKEKNIFELEYPSDLLNGPRWFLLRVMNFESDTPKVVLAHEDITERKKAEEDILRKNVELQKTTDELDKFVYSVSHDLRAPLLSMQGVVDITAEETTEELTMYHMKMLGGSINRLDTFIGEILNYSQNARSEIISEKIDFKELVGKITHDLKYISVYDGKVKIHADIIEKGIFFSDKKRISMVLNNLISNAIRYHNPYTDKPFVKINVVADEVKTKIEIEDNGIGIDEKFQEKVFEMFYRVSESSNGSGLGLYIVKETIEKLHGAIYIQSKRGIGTKFSVSIPNLYSNHSDSYRNQN
ncbi:MAG: PAS domain S-box protein [Bacteroidia bacterium]